MKEGAPGSLGRLVDIVEQGVDAGGRLGEAVKLGSDLRFLAVTSPDYLHRFGTPRVPDDPRQHHCIRQRLPSGKRYRWEFERRGQEITIDVPGTLTLDEAPRPGEASSPQQAKLNRDESDGPASVVHRHRRADDIRAIEAWAMLQFVESIQQV